MWSHKLGTMRNEITRGTAKLGEISKKVQERSGKLYGQVMTTIWVK